MHPGTILFRSKLELLFALAWKSVRVKYKNSALGILWSLVNPLLFLLIFSYIFGQAFAQIANYKLFALTGLVAWSLMPAASNQVIHSLVENAAILKSIRIPSIIFPASSLTGAVFNFGFTLIPFSFLMIYFGWNPGLEALLALPVLLLYALFIGGFSLILASVNVYYRDAGLLWGTLNPALFYFTPIAYPVELIPDNIRWIMQFNPFYHFIQSFRDIVYSGIIPDADAWLIMLALSLSAVTCGLIVYRKLEKGFISNY